MKPIAAAMATLTTLGMITACGAVETGAHDKAHHADAGHAHVQDVSTAGHGSHHNDRAHGAHGKHPTPAATHATTALSATFSAATEDGLTRTIKLNFTDLQTGEGLGPDDFTLAHTKKVHLLIIDESLGDYHHIHPVAGPDDGVWTFAFTPEHPRRYRAWADIVRADSGAQEYVTVNLDMGGETPPTPDRMTVLSGNAGGLVWTMALDRPLEVGAAAKAEIMVKTEDGEPFSDLEPVLGAFAHMVGFYEDFETVVHVHPLGEEPSTATARGGPVTRFHIAPTAPGLVRFWAQFKANGEEIFVPFTTMVAPPA